MQCARSPLPWWCLSSACSALVIQKTTENKIIYIHPSFFTIMHSAKCNGNVLWPTLLSLNCWRTLSLSQDHDGKCKEKQTRENNGCGTIHTGARKNTKKQVSLTEMSQHKKFRWQERERERLLFTTSFITPKIKLSAELHVVVVVAAAAAFVTSLTPPR